MSTQTFGGIIKLQGEKEYRQAISQINSDLKVLGSELGKITAEFGRNDKSVEGLTSRNKVLNDQIEAQKSKVSNLKAALAESSEKYGENDKRTQAWQVSLNKAEAELIKMEKELDKNNSSLEKYKSYSEQTTSTIGKLNSEIQTLNKDLEKADVACQKSGNSTESLKDKQEVLGEILGKQSEKVKTLEEALDTAKSAFGENSDETKKWENTLNSSKKELNGTQQELKNVDNQMQSASKTTSTFGDTLKAVLAADVIKSGVKMITDSIKDIGKYMGDAIGSAASFGKEISLMSEKTGVSTENLQKFQAASKVTGVDIDTFTSTLTRSIRSMNSASEGSGAASKAYKELGVSVTDSSGQLRNSEEVYWDTIDALKNMENETQRDAYAMQIFGKSAMELNPIIKRGSEGFKEITGSMVTFDEDTIESMRSLDISMGRLGGVMDGVKRAVGASFVPAMNEIVGSAASVGGAFRNIFMTLATGGDMDAATNNLVNTVSTMVDKLQEAIPKLMETANSMIEALATGISAALPSIVNAVVPMIPGIISTLMSGINQLIPVAKDIIMALINGIIAALPAIVSGAAQMISALVSGISKALPVLIPAAVKIVMEIVGALLDNVDLLLDAAFELLLAIVDAIPPTIDALLSALPKLIESVINFLLNNFGKLIEGAIKLFNVIIEAIPKIIVTLVNKLPEIIQSIVFNLTKPETILTLLNAAVQMFMALVTAIPKITIEIVKSLPQIITGIVNSIGSFYGTMANAGLNLLKGLWQGINDAGAWLWNKISGLFGGIMDKIKGFFGIKSPSTLFKNQIGKNLALGLGEGFADEMDSVAREMQDAITTNFDLEPIVNTGYSDAIENPVAAAMNNPDYLISAFQQALNGMAFMIDGDKMGEMVVNKVERVVFA